MITKEQKIKELENSKKDSLLFNSLTKHNAWIPLLKHFENILNSAKEALIHRKPFGNIDEQDLRGFILGIEEVLNFILSKEKIFNNADKEINEIRKGE